MKENYRIQLSELISITYFVFHQDNTKPNISLISLYLGKLLHLIFNIPVPEKVIPRNPSDLQINVI